MKALTISQPYASLIVDGHKPFENRTWECLYRGPLAIHAGKGKQYLDADELKAYPTSAILGVCEVYGCIHVPSAREAVASGRSCNGFAANELSEMLAHPHCEGPYAILLRDIRKLPEPLAIGGKQGLWNVPGSYVLQIEAALSGVDG